MSDNKSKIAGVVAMSMVLPVVAAFVVSQTSSSHGGGAAVIQSSQQGTFDIVRTMVAIGFGIVAAVIGLQDLRYFPKVGMFLITLPLLAACMLCRERTIIGIRHHEWSVNFHQAWILFVFPAIGFVIGRIIYSSKQSSKL